MADPDSKLSGLVVEEVSVVLWVDDVVGTASDWLDQTYKASVAKQQLEKRNRAIKQTTTDFSIDLCENNIKNPPLLL